MIRYDEELLLWYGWPMKGVNLVSSQDHCQRSSPFPISDKLQAGFEPAQDLSSGLVEWSCAVVIITTPRYYCMIVFSIIFLSIISLMQSVNGAQFLNITFLFLLFGAVAVAIAVFGFVIVPLTCMHHCNHINSTFALRFYAQFDTWVIIVYLVLI